MSVGTFKCCKNKDLTCVVCRSCYSMYHRSCLERKNIAYIDDGQILCSTECEEKQENNAIKALEEEIDKLNKELREKDAFIKKQRKKSQAFEEDVLEAESHIGKELEECKEKLKSTCKELLTEKKAREEDCAIRDEEIKKHKNEVQELKYRIQRMNLKKENLEKNITGLEEEIKNLKRKLNAQIKPNMTSKEVQVEQDSRPKKMKSLLADNEIQAYIENAVKNEVESYMNKKIKESKGTSSISQHQTREDINITYINRAPNKLCKAKANCNHNYYKEAHKNLWIDPQNTLRDQMETNYNSQVFYNSKLKAQSNTDQEYTNKVVLTPTTNLRDRNSSILKDHIVGIGEDTVDINTIDNNNNGNDIVKEDNQSVFCDEDSGDNDVEWKTVLYKKGQNHRNQINLTKSRRPEPLKGSNNNTTALKPALRMSFLFLSGLSPETTSETVIKYLEENGLHENVSCEKMKTKKEKYRSSFRLSVPYAEKEKYLRTDLWPTGSTVNHFLNLQRQKQIGQRASTEQMRQR